MKIGTVILAIFFPLIIPPRCTNCGRISQKIRFNANFCSYCGKKF